jgi:hypothetical protein
MALITSFDFTIASAAIWFHDKKWQSMCHERFYGDLSAKRLVYMSPVREEEAGGSMLRILKFYQRGYRIPLDSLAKVMTRVFKAVERPDALTEEKLAWVVHGLLREVDPLIDPNHQSHLPSTTEEQTND